MTLKHMVNAYTYSSVHNPYHVGKLLKDAANVPYCRFHFMQRLIPAGQVVVLRSSQRQLLLLLLWL